MVALTLLSDPFTNANVEKAEIPPRRWRSPREALSKVEDGEAKYIFLAPEQLGKEDLFNTLGDAKVALLVVDEAHCISQWGHDFRPDYLRIGEVIEELGHPTVLAMTATASKRVRQEIIGSLRMKSPKVLLQGFDRPEIYLQVDHFKQKDEKLEAIVHRASWADKPGIIYAATRKGAEEIAHRLLESGVETLLPYRPEGTRARGHTREVYEWRCGFNCGDERIRHGRGQGERSIRLSL